MFRFGIGIRGITPTLSEDDKPADGALLPHDWTVFSLQGFAGLAVDSRNMIGGELGVWISGDVTSNQLIRTDLGAPGAALEELVDPMARFSIGPHLALRLIL